MDVVYSLLGLPRAVLQELINLVPTTPTEWLVFFLLIGLVYLFVIVSHRYFAPEPRAPLPSEKAYLTSTASGSQPAQRQLPCWYDQWLAERHTSERRDPELGRFHIPDDTVIEAPEVLVSAVFPAYNESERIRPALAEAVEYLDKSFGRPAVGSGKAAAGKAKKNNDKSKAAEGLSGYEILVVSDGSKDDTVDVVLAFARENDLHDVVRVVKLEKNRGKGGAITHGFRHVRGEYILFADSDGASKFSYLGRLIEGCDAVKDGAGRGIAVGSRSHMVGSEAVVKRSLLRNFLMRAFHIVIMILTPPATSRIKDTQCGFKLFSRATLPHIVPFMHTEGWIFDIEMLMLAESAPPSPVVSPSDGTVIGAVSGIKVAEIPIDWHEVDGSKMSLATDSIKMALRLAHLRASWMMGVYRRRLT